MVTVSALSKEQISQLSDLIAELLDGQVYNRETVDELCGMLLENVSGMESISDQLFQEITNEIWQQLNSK